jgi:hypothetical protein
MELDKNRLVLGLIFSVVLILYAGNAGAVEFKLGEFNISMNTPEIDHISYKSDTYKDFEVNTASFGVPSSVISDLSYEVTILRPLSGVAEDYKSTIIRSPKVSVSDIEIDGKPATMVLADQFTTIAYLKDDKALITLQFKEAEGTDSSDLITETIKSFKATRA